MMGFQIGFKDIIDIVSVAILLFYAYRLLKKTGALNVFFGVITFIFVWYLVSFVFKMDLLGSILDAVANVGSFALVVIFQNEIRRFFSKLGSRRNWGIFGLIRKLMKNGTKTDKTDQDILQVVLACRNLAKTATGGLIVIRRDSDLSHWTQTGEYLDARINSRLIENIFFKNSPLHDGALILSKHKIEVAGAILPVSRNQSIPKRLGLRHRSALGVTEQTDAIAITISEETGQISWAVDGKLTINVKAEQLEQFLYAELVPDDPTLKAE